MVASTFTRPVAICSQQVSRNCPRVAELKTFQGTSLIHRGQPHPVCIVGSLASEQATGQIGEHALGHTLRGSKGFTTGTTTLLEKRVAFEKLAELVERIVNPPTDNVASFAR
jgi:hypothetical protein